jgi:hypothetical protein
MKNRSINIKWKKILFPILEDFESINNDYSDSARISINNWNVANNSKEYIILINDIEGKKHPSISAEHENLATKNK